jgi:hypothetical protein
MSTTNWSPLACLLGVVLSATSVQADTPAVVIPIAYTPSTERVYAGVPVVQRLITTFADLPEHKLREVLLLAYCESDGWIHRYPSGELRPHKNRESSARGVMQVLATLHAPELRRRKLDLRDDDDYFQFVRILYDREGLSPWKSSQKCLDGENELGRQARNELEVIMSVLVHVGVI